MYLKKYSLIIIIIRQLWRSTVSTDARGAKYIVSIGSNVLAVHKKILSLYWGIFSIKNYNFKCTMLMFPYHHTYLSLKYTIFKEDT